MSSVAQLSHGEPLRLLRGATWRLQLTFLIFVAVVPGVSRRYVNSFFTSLQL